MNNKQFKIHEKELKKQLKRFDQAKTMKTLMASLNEIMKLSYMVRQRAKDLKLTPKEQATSILIFNTFKVRSTDRWQRLLDARLKKR